MVWFPTSSVTLLPKLSQLDTVYQDYSNSKVGRFLEHSVYFCLSLFTVLFTVKICLISAVHMANQWCFYNFIFVNDRRRTRQSLRAARSLRNNWSACHRVDGIAWQRRLSWLSVGQYTADTWQVSNDVTSLLLMLLAWPRSTDDLC